MNPRTFKIFQTFLRNFSSSGHQNFEPVIGLEVHCQILTESKLFSSAPTRFLSRANSQATFFDVSLPGTLPVLNEKCIQMAVKTALALNCQVAERSTFDRKHYFYGDMPNGYQITQQRDPIAKDGYIEFIVYDELKPAEPYIKRCRLKQIQVEQDSGKSLQDEDSGVNLIDLNRAGVPLMEFVFDPDLNSSLEATCLVRELITVLKAIQVCSCKMEEGALRVDANISVRRINDPTLGTRTEVKNLNSFRFIREASDYEIRRQIEILSNGGSIINETLGYDFRTRRTFPMRDKEIVQDYRFMPEPNLPPVVLDQKQIQSIGKELPELMPQIQRENFLSEQYGLTLDQVFLLLNDTPEARQLFLAIHSTSDRKNGPETFQFLWNYLKPIFEKKIDPITMIELQPGSNQLNLKDLTEVPGMMAHLGEMCDMLQSRQISQSTAVDMLKLYAQWDSQKQCPSPRQMAQDFNWWMVEDSAEIERICRLVVEAVPKLARKYARNGVRKPQSMLIQRAFVLLNNRVNEDTLWKAYDKILRGSEGIKKQD